MFWEVFELSNSKLGLVVNLNQWGRVKINRVAKSSTTPNALYTDSSTEFFPDASTIFSWFSDKTIFFSSQEVVSIQHDFFSARKNSCAKKKNKVKKIPLLHGNILQASENVSVSIKVHFLVTGNIFVRGESTIKSRPQKFNLCILFSLKENKRKRH